MRSVLCRIVYPVSSALKMETVGFSEKLVSTYDSVPRHKPERNIAIDLKGIVWEVMDCIHLAQDRDQWLSLINTAVNFLVPQIVEYFMTSLATVTPLRRTLIHRGGELVS
jgi:hypothetical protein